MASTHLFADRPGAFDQLPLSVGVGWTYLQGPGFLDQEDAAVSKFLNPGSDLEPYLWSRKMAEERTADEKAPLWVSFQAEREERRLKGCRKS